MAILLGDGCARTLQMEPVLQYFPQAVLVERLPLVAGVYYTPEFRAMRSGGDVDFAVGATSVALFNRVLPAMFDEITQLAGPPPAPYREQNVACVIVPSIESVETRFMQRVRVAYRIRVSSPQGVELAAWTVSGTGGEPYGAASQATLGEAVASALRNAMAGFVIGFRGQPGMREWLATRGLGVRNGPAESSPVQR